MKNRFLKKLLTIGLLLALAACIFSGCASTGSKEPPNPPGILTITGIPAEYEGKFISADINNIPDFSKAIQTSSTIAITEDRAIEDSHSPERRYIAIKDGEVKLPFYVKKAFGNGGGYAGSDTADVKLEIADREKAASGKYFTFPLLSRAAIASVAFEDGVAEAKWDDACKPVYITVTNISEIFNGSSTIQVGQKAIKLPSIGNGPVVFGHDAAAASGSAQGSVRDGITTVVVLPSRKASGFMPFPESGTMDVVVSLFLPAQKVAQGVNMPSGYHVFLFKDAQFTDSKADLDFRQGARQQ